MISLRRRLLVWLLTGQLLAVLLAGAVTFLQVRREVDQLRDAQLRQLAEGLVQAQFAPRSEQAAAQAAGPIRVQVWESGELRFDSRPAMSLPRQAAPGFGSYRHDGQQLRSYLALRGARAVQVSEDLGERLEAAWEVAWASLGPVLGLIPLLALLVWFGVGYGMRPLRRVTTAIGERRADSLQPLPAADLPREIRPLVEELNDLLRRLGQALESQRKFVADAAHELRTPLTAVRLQSQLLERAAGEEDRQQALQQIRASVDRAAHLVQQLLTLARLAPEATAAPATVDVGALASEVVAEYAPLALRAGLDLGLAECAPAAVAGEAESLRVMLGNLVDNALRYTPRGGQIDVSVAAGAEVTVTVTDSGPGIPAADRERVFDRFYRRLGSGVDGSGLGLAIVREVVARHGGSVTLGEPEAGSGLRVEVRLPRT